MLLCSKNHYDVSPFFCNTRTYKNTITTQFTYYLPTAEMKCLICTDNVFRTLLVKQAVLIQLLAYIYRSSFFSIFRGKSQTHKPVPASHRYTATLERTFHCQEKTNPLFPESLGWNTLEILYSGSYEGSHPFGVDCCQQSDSGTCRLPHCELTSRTNTYPEDTLVSL